MSQGQPILLEQAQPIAEELLEALRPACTRIEIAGSIRRQKPMVADIEIVAMPAFEERQAGDLWATPVRVDLLAARLNELRHHEPDGLGNARLTARAPDPKTYVFWNTVGGEIHSLRWMLFDGTWRVVPGSAIAYLDFALVPA